MNTKLLIGAIAIFALVVIFYSSRPAEVVAPVTESATELAQSETTPQPSPSDTVSTTPPVTNSVTETPVTTPKPTAPSPKPTPTLPYSATVVYDGDRFIPDAVTIIEGGTIRFMNTSSEKMWIGADNHPMHDRYPVKSDGDCFGSSFDQCTAVGNGTSWSYTFTRTGTWGYHNHTRARDTGSVTVMTKEEYLKAQ